MTKRTFQNGDLVKLREKYSRVFLPAGSDKAIGVVIDYRRPYYIITFKINKPIITIDGGLIDIEITNIRRELLLKEIESAEIKPFTDQEYKDFFV